MNLQSLQLAKSGGKILEGQIWKTAAMSTVRRQSVIVSRDNDASTVDESSTLISSILRRRKMAIETDVNTMPSQATDLPGSPNSSRPNLLAAVSKMQVLAQTARSSKVTFDSQQRISSSRDNKFPPITLPEQNVKAKKSKKSKPIQGK